MKIVSIFEKVNERLFAAKFEAEKADELDKALDLWRQADGLREFFIKYRSDLMMFEPGMKVQTAVNLVTDEAESIYDALSETAMSDHLDDLFKPLDNREEHQPRYEFQKFKARGQRRKSMLRLYAIKFTDVYVISGSAIKLTDKMDRPHLKTELHKLELLKQYLQIDGIVGTFVYLEIDV